MLAKATDRASGRAPPQHDEVAHECGKRRGTAATKDLVAQRIVESTFTLPTECRQGAVFRPLQSDCQGREDIGNGADRQPDSGGQRSIASSQQACSHDQAQFPQIAAQEQTQGTTNVAPEAAALDEGLHQRGKIVIGKDHIGRLAGYLRATSSHRDTHIGQA